MKYFLQYKEADAEIVEITKEEARNILEGNWSEKFLNDIFDNGKCFRLYTMFSTIWSETDDGIIPPDGYFGVVERAGLSD